MNVTTRLVTTPGARVALDERLAPANRPLWSMSTSQSAMPTAPLIWQDRLLFVDGPAEGEPTTLYCVAATDGSEIWSRLSDSTACAHSVSALCGGLALFHGIDWSHPLQAYSINTGACQWTVPDVRPGSIDAITADRRVFIDDNGSGAPRLCAIESTTGAMLWSQNYGGVACAEALIGTVLVLLVQDQAIDRTDVVAVSSEGGQELWRSGAGLGASFVQVSAAEQCVIATSADGIVMSLSLESGQLRWRWRSNSGTASPPIQVDDEVMFVSDGCFVVLDVRTGAERRRVPIQPHKWPGPSCGLVAGDMYLFGTGSGVSALNRDTGRLVWEWAPGVPCGAPVAHQGRLFVATADGKVHCL